MLLLSVVGAVVVTLLAGHADADSQRDIPLWVLGLGQVPLSLAYVGAAAVVLRRHGGSLRDLGLRFEWIDVPIGIAAGLVSQLVVVLLYLPVGLFTDLDLSEEARELTDRVGGAGTAVILVTMVVFLAPVVEELFFRGVLLRASPQRPTWQRVAVSSAVFGAVHFQPLQFFGLAVFGVILAMLTTRYDRLGPAIIAHMVFNAITVAVLLSG